MDKQWHISGWNNPEPNDTFFTKPNIVKECWEAFTDTMTAEQINIDDYDFIEPSAGSGAWLDVLPSDTTAMDIAPQNNRIEQANFLEWQRPKNNKKPLIAIGNPPFGWSGKLAKLFIQKLSSLNVAYIGFILPPCFFGVNLTKTLTDYRYKIIAKKLLPDNSFSTLQGNNRRIPNTHFLIMKLVDPEMFVLNDNVFNYDDYFVLKTFKNADKDTHANADIFVSNIVLKTKAQWFMHDDIADRGYGIAVYIKQKKPEIINAIKNTEWYLDRYSLSTMIGIAHISKRHIHQALVDKGIINM